MASITASTSATLDTALNLREDLGNVIFNVTPFKTPFMSNIGKTRATNNTHEWLTDTYRASVSSNAAIEAEAQTLAAGDTRTRLGNEIQIADDIVTVTLKAELLNRAGVPGKEMAYQLMKIGKELQMDVEAQLLSNQQKVPAASGTAGVSASVSSWIATNFDGAGSAPTGDGTDAATLGVDRAITDTILQGVLDGVWNNSGDFSGHVLMADASTVGSMRNALGGMSDATNQDITKEGAIIARFAVYESQFGPVAVVPNKHTLANTIYCLDYSTWAIAFAGGKMIHTTDIATITSAEAKLLEIYYTLCAKSEAANGVCHDIT